MATKELSMSEAGYKMLTDDTVVGYQYRAAYWCGNCVCERLVEDYETLVRNPQHASTYEEEILDYATFLGVNYYDEYSYDTDNFPKPLYNSQLIHPEYCNRCFQPL